MTSKRNMVFSHAALFLYILVIFVSIPYIPDVTSTAGNMFGKYVFGWIVISLTVGIYAAAFFLLRKKARVPGLDPDRSLLWISVIAAVYLLLASLLWKQAVETVHLMEYGLLSWLLFQALKYHIQDSTLFVRSALIVLFVGTLDEIIQWFTAGRTWGFGDIRMNFIAGVLLQVGVWKTVWKEKCSRKVPPASITAASIWLVACLLLIGLCTSNTDSRFYYYKNRISFLSDFHERRGMIQDFGHIISDPDIGIFYSRFTKEELAAIDAYGASVHKEPLVLGGLSPQELQQLLGTYTARTFPFLRELKLHAILRDGNYDLAGKAGVGKKESFLTAAYQENQILQNYYGKTLGRSVYTWPKGRADKIEDRIDNRQRYDSPANSRLITEFSEKGIWAGILFVIAGIVGFNLAFRRRYQETYEKQSD